MATRRNSARLSRQSKLSNESEKLLRDSDEEVSEKDNSTRRNTSNDSEIILDDSDSDIEEILQVASPKATLGKPKPKPFVTIQPQALSKTQPQSNKTNLDENKIKTILNNVANSKSNSQPVRSPKLNPRLNISLSDKKVPGEKPQSKSRPGTPKIVLQKVGSKWQNSSTPLTSKSKLISDSDKFDEKAGSRSDSNSDEDFVPVKKGKGIKTGKARKSDDSGSDSGGDDLDETIPMLNRSTRSTRSSVNTSRSDISHDVSLDASEEFNDEIQEELAKLEALQNILAQTKPKLPADKDMSRSISKHKKSKATAKGSLSNKTYKPPISDLPKITPKLAAAVPKVIERGPMDCFDDLIVETTAGFPCNYCESKEMFKKRKDMIHHMQSLHDEELNDEQRNRDLSGLFSCEICNTTFYSKFILRTHKKAHMKSARAGCDKYYQYYLKFGKV